MIKRALLSYGVGPHADYLDIARPSFLRFALKHGYDPHLNEFEFFPERHPSWWKVPAIHALFAEGGYDEVLFIGADLVIMDSSEDLNVPEDKWQALVAHYTNEGEVPNADMWFLRKPMVPYLEQIWKMDQYLNHGWWEQRALIDLMGYHPDPFRVSSHTDLYEHTYFLDQGWNVHIWDARMTPQTSIKIQHATMWPDRAAIMREWAEEAK